MKHSKLSLGLLALTLFTAGCRYSVNLIAERRSFDAYVEAADRARGQVAAKQAFYDEASKETSDADQTPYPLLASDLDAMKQRSRDLASSQQRIRAFEAKYDRFCKGRALLNSDEEQDWAQFKDLQAQFRPLGEDMDAILVAYNQAANDFDAQCRQYGIAKVSAADLRRQISDFQGRIDDAVPEIKGRVEAYRQGLRMDAVAAVMNMDPGYMKHKIDLLKGMEDMMPGFFQMKKDADSSGDAILQSLPQAGLVWTGPGMESGDASISDFWQLRDNFEGSHKNFDKMAKDFEAPPEQHHDHDHDHDQGGGQGGGQGGH
jgi:hypothetical protein